MKKDKKIIVLTIILVVSICLMVYLTLKNDDNVAMLNKVLVYVITILNIVIASILIVTLRIPKPLVYISHSPNDTDISSKLSESLKNYTIIGSSYILPGEKLSESSRRGISISSLCMVLITSNDLSDFQKQEIKIMKHLRKKIIPICADDSIEIPQILKDYKAISLDDLCKTNK